MENIKNKIRKKRLTYDIILCNTLLPALQVGMLDAIEL